MAIGDRRKNALFGSLWMTGQLKFEYLYPIIFIVWRKALFYNLTMFARQKPNKSIKLTSWAVIAAVFMLSVFPVHMHLHHDDHHAGQFGHDSIVSSIDDHTDTLHAVSDLSGHDGHEDATVLSATSDTLIKKLNGSDLLLLAVLLVVFLSFNLKSLSQKFYRTAFIFNRKLYTYHSPPLRAPPLQ